MSARFGLAGRLLAGALVQRFHDAALRPGAVAAGAQFAQVALQRAQLGQALAHMLEVRVQRGVGGGAVQRVGQV